MGVLIAKTAKCALQMGSIYQLFIKYMY